MNIKTKKIIIFLSIFTFSMLFILSIFTTLFLIKTFSKSNIQKIDLIYQEDAIIQDINNVRLDLFQLEICYENGEKERKIVKKSMVSYKDLSKLQNTGLQNITVNYDEFKLNIDIFIFDNSYILENDVYILYNLEQLELTQNIDEYIPEKEGWYFAGWYTDENCEEVYVKENSSKGPKKLYASWSRKPVYTVKFMLDETTCLKEEKVVEGGNATPPVISTDTQQIFIGWDKSFENVRENLIIYAKFQTPLIEVNFVGMNNEIIAHYIVEKGSKIIPPSAPRIEGYEFVGWSEDTDYITKSLVIKAIYKNILSVYYYDSDLTTILYIMDTYEYPKDPTKEGLRFDKWVEINTNQPNTKSYYATYKELESTLKLCLQDSYEIKDNVLKTTIELYINKETIKFIDINGTTHTFRENNKDINYFYQLSGISRMTGIYGIYEWFTDSSFNDNIDLKEYIEQIQNNDEKMYEDYILYGKKVEAYPIDNNIWSYTLNEETDTYRLNYIGLQKNDSEIYEIFVPDTYMGKKVTVIDTLEVPSNSIVYIGENIEKINLATTNICNAFIVSEKNKNYESYCGILLDINRSSIAKMCNDTNKNYGLLALDKNVKEDIFNNQESIKSKLKTNYDSIDSYSFSNYFILNPTRRWTNNIVFQDNIKIYKNAFSNNYMTVNLCFSGDFVLMDEEDESDYFGFMKSSQIKINYMDIYDYDFDKIVEITNKIIENTETSFTIFLYNVNPSFQPIGETDQEYLILQKIAKYYEENYDRTTSIIYGKTSSITISK